MASPRCRSTPLNPEQMIALTKRQWRMIADRLTGTLGRGNARGKFISCRILIIIASLFGRLELKHSTSRLFSCAGWSFSVGDMDPRSLSSWVMMSSEDFEGSKLCIKPQKRFKRSTVLAPVCYNSMCAAVTASEWNHLPYNRTPNRSSQPTRFDFFFISSCAIAFPTATTPFCPKRVDTFTLPSILSRYQLLLVNLLLTRGSTCESVSHWTALPVNPNGPSRCDESP